MRCFEKWTGYSFNPVFKRYHSDQHFFWSFYLQDGGKNQLAYIDTEQNYVTVTLCKVFGF